MDVRKLNMKTKDIKNIGQAWMQVQENQQKALAKKLAKASASSEKGKAAVTLPKAPFEIPEDIPANERTAFHGAAAAAHKAGKSHFTMNGKKYPVTMKKDAAHAIADDVKESVEQIDEISKDKVGRYIKKAMVSTSDAGMDTASQDKDIRKRGINTFVKRRMGASDAVRKLTGKARVNATEQDEAKLCPHCEGSMENHSPDCKMANKANGNETAEANPKMKESKKWPIYSRIMEKKDEHTKGATPV